MEVVAGERFAVALRDTAPGWMVVLTGLLALLTVLGNRVWFRMRHLNTAVHEGGHAIIAFVTGREVWGVWLDPQGGGWTSSYGYTRGFGIFATTAAGYVGPPITGLASASLLGAGNVTAVLVLAVTGLACLLPVVLNRFAVILVASVGVLLIVIGRSAPAWVQTGVAHYLTWFLLFAGPKSVLILHRARRRGAEGSDADLLASQTHIPGLIWVLAFAAVSLWCALKGAGILLR